MTVNLYPHQQKAVEELGNGKILCGDVGVGKTITALAYYYTKVCGAELNKLGSMKTPKDVIVITTAKKRDSLDWQRDAAKLGISTKREFSVDGVQITVDSWNNIEKYKETTDAFFIFDEQRVVGSGAWVKSFIHIARHNGWILLSATPGDTWLDYIPVFVANGWYRNRTAFIREHVIYSYYQKFPKVERYIGVNKLTKYRNAVLVDMPLERHTTRHVKIVQVEFDKQLFEKAWVDRWHVYEERPLRDISELFSVLRKVVNGDDTRLAAIRSLMSSHPRLIVFYNFDYELEALRALGSPTSSSDTTAPATSERSGAASAPTSDAKTDPLKGTIWETGFDEKEAMARITQSSTGSASTISSHPTDEGGGRPTSGQSFAIAEWNGHKHEPIPDTDRWVYLVQYVAGAEGWNCTSTDAVVFYSLTYSFKNFHQSMGRIDRLDTPFSDLYYYVLKSDSWIDRAVWKSLREKRSFNERKTGIKF